MKTVKSIIAFVVLASLFFSFSGKIVNMSYCYHSDHYSLFFNQPSGMDHRNTSSSCCSDQSAFNPCANDFFCYNSHYETGFSDGLCCLDIQTTPNTDKDYTNVEYKSDLKPFIIAVLYSTIESVLFESNPVIYHYNKIRDHSPPSLITSKVLII